MSRKLISLKTLLEEEDVKDKVDETEDKDKVDEIDGGTGSDKDRPNVRESEDEKKDESEDEKKDESEDERKDESEDEEQKDEDDSVNSWLNFGSKKPGPIRTESGLGEPDEVKSKLDGEGKPGETKQTPDKLDNEGKPGETKQATGGTTGDNKDRPNVKESEDERKDESDDEERKDEEAKEKLESEDDEDLLLLDESEDERKDESEDEDKVDEIDGGTGSDKDRPNVRESEDEKKDESDDDKRLDDDEKKVEEAVLDRMLKALKVDESELATFKDILRGAINESVNRTTRKAVKKARSIIVKEANERIRLAGARKKAAIKKVNEISARAYARFEENHAQEIKKLAQFDEMVNLLKGVNHVMESFGLAMAPTNKKLQIQLENARKSHAREVASLKAANEKLVTEAERLKIRTSLERLSKTMTESERGEFISIVSEMKVESHADFIKRATKVRDRLYKEGNSEYNQFVERFTESQTLVNKQPAKVVVEEKAPRNVMEASMDVLRNM